MLIKDKTRTSRAMVSKVARGMPEESISKTFTSLVLNGKMRTAVRFVTLRGAGGVLLPNSTDAKSGRPFINVLRKKHPALIVSDVKVLDHYNVVPECVLLDITEDTVENISGKMTGAAGPGGIDANGLQQWLLRFGIASQRLYRAGMSLACWMVNDFLSWATTPALLSN